jgi:superfamily II DNA/RNA helicase
MDAQITALRKGVDVVVGTPGRLIDLIERGELSVGHVEVLVVDEADRMADMGFMPQVQKILYGVRGEHQTMLFSATLDGAVKRLVDRYLHDPVHHEVEAAEATVDEMEHRFLLVHQLDKVKVAAAIAKGATRTLLFVRTKRGADRLVTQLRREGVRAGAIHGDLRQAARERALADFAAGKLFKDPKMAPPNNKLWLDIVPKCEKTHLLTKEANDLYNAAWSAVEAGKTSAKEAFTEANRRAAPFLKQG